MIIDCRTWKTKADCEANSRRVFVDGVQRKGVWYIDTDAGFVRTYLVAEDVGPVHVSNLSAEQRERGIREGWDMPLDAAVSKTIPGVVELRPFNEQ